jgi:ribosomal protein L37AE/L43A
MSSYKMPELCHLYGGRGQGKTAVPMTPEAQERAVDTMQNQFGMATALSNLPPFEVLRHRLIMALFGALQEVPDEELVYQIVYNRLSNMACNVCKAKPQNTPGVVLWQCGKCKLNWYCSRAHQTLDWKDGNHKGWCCKGANATPHTFPSMDTAITQYTNVHCLIHSVSPLFWYY